MPSALIIRKVDGERGKVYYPLQLIDVPKPTPGPKQVLIKLNAAALNHRDLFIRQDLYPSISFTAPLFADGHGIVVGKGDGCTRDLEGKRVLLMPCVGWDSDPDGPEAGDAFTILGASAPNPAGMGQEYIVFDEDNVELAPEHLSAVEAAALPLVGLTGWRALVTKSKNAEKGRNILVTGIGGGVALQVLQFAVAMGCNVYVTSGDEAKIDKAKRLGAKGGVSYKSATWEQDLKKMLPDERKYIDAIIDGAGGDIVLKSIKGRGDKRLLKQGGVIVQYGMTVGPKMTWTMNAVLMNVELKGSTMGSRKEFRDMMQFVREKKITPVISRVVKGLNNTEGIERLFQDMKDGKQFGKLVIEIDEDAGAKLC